MTLSKGARVETVVAELTLTSPRGVEVVKGFDAAWARSLELPMPVHSIFNGWTRA